MSTPWSEWFRFLPANDAAQPDDALSAAELLLRAEAVEQRALVHDKQQGSCPADFHDAVRRAAQLRELARRRR